MSSSAHEPLSCGCDALAVRCARAEIERDQALERLEESRWTLVSIVNDKPITLFGRSPDYWLNMQAECERFREALRRIAEGDVPVETTLKKVALRALSGEQEVAGDE